jgi:hypothetical protein
MEENTMATRRDPVQVTARELIFTLRHEAAAYSPHRTVRDLMADIAARDLVDRGKVRIVGSSALRSAA